MPRKAKTEPPPVVKIVHFADPWCWWSWGLEPVLRRLKEVYGDRLEIEYRMGGTFERLDEWMKEYGVDEKSTVAWIRLAPGLPKRSPVDILEYMERHAGDLTPAHEIAEVFQIPEADAAARLRNLEAAEIGRASG